MRITITLPKEIGDIVENDSAQRKITKSDFIVQAVQAYVKGNQPEKMTDLERISLEQQIETLKENLNWTRGQLVETQRNLSAALEKIPRITDGTTKPAWWQFWKKRDAE